jgi:hypothetical protein
MLLLVATATKRQIAILFSFHPPSSSFEIVVVSASYPDETIIWRTLAADWRWVIVSADVWQRERKMDLF